MQDTFARGNWPIRDQYEVVTRTDITRLIHHEIQRQVQK